MEDNQMIHRFHGSVALHETQTVEENLIVRNLQFSTEKTRIARFAASLIRQQDFVYIDAGSTTTKMVQFITAKNIHVMTQSITNLLALSQKGIKCSIGGGCLKTQNDIIVANKTIQEVSELTFSKCFIGANGLHGLSGFTTIDDMECMLKRAAIQHSLDPYILADSSKINVLLPMKFADLDAATLITDHLVESFDYSRIKRVISVTERGVSVMEYGVPKNQL